jgi:hypothetical protein
MSDASGNFAKTIFAKSATIGWPCILSANFATRSIVDTAYVVIRRKIALAPGITTHADFAEATPAQVAKQKFHTDL